jgi:hypothetical protein
MVSTTVYPAALRLCPDPGTLSAGGAHKRMTSSPGCPAVLPGPAGRQADAEPAVRATIMAARSRTFTFPCWEVRRRASNACSSVQPRWAMMMPLACSITGMLVSRDRSRAYAEYRSRSRSVRAASRRARRRSDRTQVASISCQFSLIPRLAARSCPARSRACWRAACAWAYRSRGWPSPRWRGLRACCQDSHGRRYPTGSPCDPWAARQS